MKITYNEAIRKHNPSELISAYVLDYETADCASYDYRVQFETRRSSWFWHYFGAGENFFFAPNSYVDDDPFLLCLGTRFVRKSIGN